MSALALATGVLNVVLGLVYLQYGVLTVIEMERARTTYGFSHFGAAWAAMAFTCGPHHLVHGAHVLLAGRAGGMMDMIAVLAGFPAGVAWFLLRVEAFRGGPGDRFLAGSPRWVLAIPTLAGAYVAALIAGGLAVGVHAPGRAWLAVPSAALVLLYGVIGYYVINAQLRNRPTLGGWSVSGLSLAIIFPTCAAMHAVFGFYLVAGRYGLDAHGFAIDCLSVPAAIYFVRVVQALYQDSFADWNRLPDAGPVDGAQLIPTGA